MSAPLSTQATFSLLQGGMPTHSHADAALEPMVKPKVGQHDEHRVFSSHPPEPLSVVKPRTSLNLTGETPPSCAVSSDLSSHAILSQNSSLFTRLPEAQAHGLLATRLVSNTDRSIFPLIFCYAHLTEEQC
jgi:hypothetical protein